MLRPSLKPPRAAAALATSAIVATLGVAGLGCTPSGRSPSTSAPLGAVTPAALTCSLSSTRGTAITTRCFTADRAGIQSAALLESGDIVVFGNFEGVLDWGSGARFQAPKSRVFVAMLNRAFEPQWALQMSHDYAPARGMAIEGDGISVLTGRANALVSDLFLHRLARNGTVRTTTALAPMLKSCGVGVARGTSGIEGVKLNEAVGPSGQRVIRLGDGIIAIDRLGALAWCVRVGPYWKLPRRVPDDVAVGTDGVTVLHPNDQGQAVLTSFDWNGSVKRAVELGPEEDFANAKLRAGADGWMVFSERGYDACGGFFGPPAQRSVALAVTLLDSSGGVLWDRCAATSISASAPTVTTNGVAWDLIEANSPLALPDATYEASSRVLLEIQTEQAARSMALVMRVGGPGQIADSVSWLPSGILWTPDRDLILFGSSNPPSRYPWSPGTSKYGPFLARLVRP